MLASAWSRISSSFWMSGIGEFGLGYRIQPTSEEQLLAACPRSARPR